MKLKQLIPKLKPDHWVVLFIFAALTALSAIAMWCSFQLIAPYINHTADAFKAAGNLPMILITLASATYLYRVFFHLGD